LLKKLHSQQVSINENCVTQYTWSVKTAADMNFVIERKLPADNDYTPVDTQVMNAGFSKQNFTFSDDLTTLQPGIIIKYRIKMNIAADTSFYLDSAEVNFDRECYLGDKIIIAPNPVINELKVTVSQNNQFKTAILLHNVAGQLVYTSINQPVDRIKTFVIPMKQMSKGVYYVTVLIDNKKKVTKKIIRE